MNKFGRLNPVFIKDVGFGIMQVTLIFPPYQIKGCDL